MTFIVQNGATKLPAAQPDPVPYLYVNGKLVATDGVVIRNGTTYADTSVIREHIDPAYAGQGAVALRSFVEGLGASVEFLPAVGDTRAAVLIYTKQ
jgi:hypothetical protein